MKRPTPAWLPDGPEWDRLRAVYERHVTQSRRARTAAVRAPERERVTLADLRRVRTAVRR